MKIYISADVEGVSSVSTWQESDMLASKEARDRMTLEVKAACEEAVECGAKEITVKDGHGYGKNIRHESLPNSVRLISSWSNHPYNMVEGIDESYDAVMFIGYHSGAGSPYSPLAHTLDRKFSKIKVNGETASEFSLYNTLTSILKIPTIVVTGDGGLIREVKNIDPQIETVATKEAFSGAVISNNPNLTYHHIKKAVEKGMKQIEGRTFDVPTHFKLEVTFNRHQDAYKYSFYPKVQQINSHTLYLEADDYFEILTFLAFM